ncbi:MAG: hypothetical protein H5U39_00295 [Deferribacterales bacterium]|nr:hypothetical protein [Deferribacterales bacterium]
MKADGETKGLKIRKIAILLIVLFFSGSAYSANNCLSVAKKIVGSAKSNSG